MSTNTIRFDDGNAYDRSMGAWSRLAGAAFLEWLAPPPGLRWIDVGCGSGVFTELLVQRCAPAEVYGVDPSEALLAHARSKTGAAGPRYLHGDAMALPFERDRFDAAVMALVIFFLPDAGKGVAEMVRVVRPGGWVVTYAWDFLGGGFPFEPVQDELRRLGLKPPLPPGVEVSRREALTALWAEAGLEHIVSHRISVERSFPDFDRFWADTTVAASLHATLAARSGDEQRRVKAALRKRLSSHAEGRVAYRAGANAISGRVKESG
jgi:SAM-dependent methyltransferase